MVECRGCGNSLHLEQPVCPYCGTRNASFRETKEEPPRTTVTSTIHTTQDNTGINVCVLILLAVVFWPGAVIYALVKMNQKKHL